MSARRRSSGTIAAAVVGGIVFLALAVAAVVALGYLFYLGAKGVLVLIARAIIDGIKDSF